MQLSRILIETILNKLGQNFHNENCWTDRAKSLSVVYNSATVVQNNR